MDEQWADVEGFEGYYQVSNLGRLKRMRGGRGSKVGRVFVTSPDGYGYDKTHLSKEGKLYSRRIHRLVAKAFLPNPHELPQVNHKDGNKLSNCVNNLEWCTAKENVRHCVKMGLRETGEAHKFAKLTVAQVLEIRKRYVKYNHSRSNVLELAREYSVCRSAITKIIRRGSWKYAGIDETRDQGPAS